MRLARVRLDDGTTVIVEVAADGYRPAAEDSMTEMLRLLAHGSGSAGAGLLQPGEVEVLCPVTEVPTIRDFMAFEEHAVNGRKGSGQPLPDAWYKVPLFYFSNTACLFGPDEAIVVPKGSRMLDFELEVACIIGTEGRDLDADDPATLDVIAGFMLMNDWSARDLQMIELPGLLGPAKGKDFAISFGPWIVTPDELNPDGKGRFSCPLTASVNGRHVGGGDLSAMYYSWAQILAHASANSRLRPGDVLGSGTVGTGCLLELRALGQRDQNPWLRPGDVVELSAGVLGSLRTPIVGRETPKSP